MILFDRDLKGHVSVFMNFTLCVCVVTHVGTHIRELICGGDRTAISCQPLPISFEAVFQKPGWLTFELLETPQPLSPIFP